MTVKKKDAAAILEAAAATFRERNAIYGNNYLRIGASLEAMFPNGITLRTAKDFTRFYFVMLAVAKLSRYNTNFHEGGHKDSVHDLVVYAALLENFDMEGK